MDVSPRISRFYGFETRCFAWVLSTSRSTLLAGKALFNHFYVLKCQPKNFAILRFRNSVFCLGFEYVEVNLAGRDSIIQPFQCSEMSAQEFRDFTVSKLGVSLGF